MATSMGDVVPLYGNVVVGDIAPYSGIVARGDIAGRHCGGDIAP